MAARSWATSIVTAIGVAAGAGAAQLGLAYGLDIVSWAPSAEATALTIWVNSLAWVAWIAATSTVVGALVADRLSPTSTPVEPGSESAGARAVTAAWRVVIALSAAVGALITVPLVAVPARTPRPDNIAPYFTAGGYAVTGVVVGLVVAIGALVARAIAANVIASSAWLWVLAIVAVADGLRIGQDRGNAQLATWKFTDAVWVRGFVNLPGALLMLAAALVIGGLAAWPAGRRGDNRVGVAVSGAAGPLLVAAAYFLAAPGLGERDQHLSAFVMAPYAVIAGLAGSVLVAAMGPKGYHTQNRALRREANEARDKRSAAEFTDWTAALANAAAAEKRPDKSGVSFESTVDDDDETVSAPAGRTYTSDPTAREYAADTYEAEPVASGGGTATATTSTTATGRASVKEPLWPDKPATAPPPKGLGKLRRGKDGSS
jgi:hypothetical protein